jgi:hypothetical protein
MVERCREAPCEPTTASEAQEQRVERPGRAQRRAQGHGAARAARMNYPGDRDQCAAPNSRSACDRVGDLRCHEFGGRRALYAQRPFEPHECARTGARPPVERQQLDRAGRQLDVVLEVSEKSKDLIDWRTYVPARDDWPPRAARSNRDFLAGHRVEWSTTR